MKAKIIVAACMIAVVWNVLYCQKLTDTTQRAKSFGQASSGIVQPWWVISRGGGTSSGGGLSQVASIGQPAAQVMNAPGFKLKEGFIHGIRRFIETSTSLNIHVQADWNLVSIPFAVADRRKSALFPSAVSAAFAYTTGYSQRDTLENGIGYWMKFPTEQTITLGGTLNSLDTIDVLSRWNMIGTISYPVATSNVTPIPPVEIRSPYFWYKPGDQYYEADTLQPGFAYWVKVNETGKIVLQRGTAFTSLIVKDKYQKKTFSIRKLAEKYNFHRIHIRDANGKEQTLYFSASAQDLDLEYFELPPPPPSGSFDVRFGSQRTIELADQKQLDEPQEYPILLQGTTSPLMVRWVIRPEENQAINPTLCEYVLEIRSRRNNQIHVEIHNLDNTGECELDNSNSLMVTLIMIPRRNIELPQEYALYQNYPNPFNPTTIIRYDIPVTTDVSLSIYDLLGREISRLVENRKEAGRYLVEWDGSRFASSIYIYRIQAGNFSDGRKMLLIR